MVNCNCNTKKQSKNKQLKEENMTNTDISSTSTKKSKWWVKHDKKISIVICITFVVVCLIYGFIEWKYSNKFALEPIN